MDIKTKFKAIGKPQLKMLVISLILALAISIPPIVSGAILASYTFKTNVTVVIPQVTELKVYADGAGTIPLTTLSFGILDYDTTTIHMLPIYVKSIGQDTTLQINIINQTQYGKLDFSTMAVCNHTDLLKNTLTEELISFTFLNGVIAGDAGFKVLMTLY